MIGLQGLFLFLQIVFGCALCFVMAGSFRVFRVFRG
jgi:hypothetical protein